MNNALRKEFPPFLTQSTLMAAIEEVCADCGKVTYLNILPPKRGPQLQCACFLRLESAAAEAALKSKLHVFEVGGNLAFFADVDERWDGPTSWARVDTSKRQCSFCAVGATTRMSCERDAAHSSPDCSCTFASKSLHQNTRRKTADSGAVATNVVGPRVGLWQRGAFFGEWSLPKTDFMDIS